MKDLGAYLASRIRGIVLFLLFAGIFFLIFALYGIPLAVVLYPALLCLALGLLFLGLDFRKTRERAQTLRRLGKDAAALLEELPAGETLCEKEWQSLCARLARQNHEQKLLFSQRERDLSDYYAAWAHQIKTPIAAMRLSLARGDSPRDRALERELRRIEEYVSMVLCYSRLEGSDWEFVEVDLDELVRALLRRFSSSFIDSRLALCYSPIRLRVLTDAKWLSFVVGQLLSNALQYTSAGSVTVRAEGSDLWIEDTGCGIAPEDLPRIFEKGFTGHLGRREARSTGLGLYLCAQICRRLKISLSAESRPGQGTAMRLHFPARLVRPYKTVRKTGDS